MTKNTLIGIVLGIIVLGGAYFLIMRDKTQPLEETPAPTTSVPDQNPPVTNTEPIAGSPKVATTATSSTSSSTALLSGQVNPNGAATNYWFDYGTTTSFGIQSTQQAIGSGYALNTAPAYITGLKANTLYYFRLSAQNRFATVTGATYTFQTNSTPPPQGMAPTTKTTAASVLLRTTANLNGQVNPNGSQTNYWFEYGKDTNLGSVTRVQSMNAGTTSAIVSVALSNLDPLTKYYFRLNAQNQFGTTNGVMMNFTTTGPAASGTPSATTTSATAIGSDKAQFTGRINPNGAETTYWFEYSTDSLLGSLIGSGTPAQIVASGNNTTNVMANVTSLQDNTKYYYRLVGRNTYGTVYGSTVSFRTR